MSSFPRFTVASAHFASRDLSESRYDFPIVGYKKWLCSLQELLCSFDARITSWNRLVTFSRQSSTVTRAINIPSKRFMKTSDHFAVTLILE